MVKLITFIIFLFLPFASSVFANIYSFFQPDSIRNIMLGEVLVVSRVEKLNSENNNVEIDTTVMQDIKGENLSNILSRFANVSIKSYGVSGISSLSIRGAGTSHTAVWNGFNLQDWKIRG